MLQIEKSQDILEGEQASKHEDGGVCHSRRSYALWVGWGRRTRERMLVSNSRLPFTLYCTFDVCGPFRRSCIYSGRGQAWRLDECRAGQIEK